MHSFLELVGIVVRHDVSVSIEQVAPQVAFLHRTEVPAVAVVVSKLCVIELRV